MVEPSWEAPLGGLFFSSDFACRGSSSQTACCMVSGTLKITVGCNCTCADDTGTTATEIENFQTDTYEMSADLFIFSVFLMGFSHFLNFDFYFLMFLFLGPQLLHDFL